MQARQTVAESDWLLQLADANPFLRGVVGWVDLRSPAVSDDLARLAAHDRFVGVRHVVQDEPDPRFLMGEAFIGGLRELQPLGLTYDLLLFPHQLPAAIELTALLPEQPFVLDHLAKPGVKAGEIEPGKLHSRNWPPIPTSAANFPGWSRKPTGQPGNPMTSAVISTLPLNRSALIA